MCGIAGKLCFDPSARAEAETLTRMARVIAHRGPDDEGVWAEGPIGLASRRLAVLDLSPRGHQPMASDDGSLHIAFNGEIYNFRELRAGLEANGCRFRSDSDTEVILQLYQRHGLAAVSQLGGMFAFALWDAPRRRLVLARDRLGKKPLFYHVTPHALVFGSEPKAIFEDASVPSAADHDAIAQYLALGYVPGAMSAFRGLARLPAAHVGIVEAGRLRLERYWQLRYEPKRRDSEGALVDEARERLGRAVRQRLVSDVPVGALLSGGLDSSAVVALMREAHTGQVNTYSIGFAEAEYDESPYAQMVARHLDTTHQSFVVRPEVSSLVQRLVWHYNEPFADSSALPSFAVSELARRHVTVALTGDGGDEAFVGYDRYRALQLATALQRLPRWVRAAAGWGARRLPEAGVRSVWSRLSRFGAAAGSPPLDQYTGWVTLFDREARRSLLTSDFAARLTVPDGESLLREAFERTPASTTVERAVGADVALYLPDDLLVKMDIASMAYGLEVRSPLLDHTLMEFAASVPLDLKLRGGVGKYLLRRAVADRLPAEVLKRPKRGFGVPLDRWFRHDLREMAHDLLLGPTARDRGYFDMAVVQRLLEDHASGRALHHHRLWALLMLELWHRQFIDRRGASTPPALVLHGETRGPERHARAAAGGPRP